jgi:ABC-2 type transport system ATP-binding protein
LTIIETTGLTKYYSRARIRALDDVSLRVAQGTIFSLLGPNGAGKTTLVKLLLGIVLPTRGSGKIKDQDIRSHKSRECIGYLAENHRFPDFLSARQTLYYYGKMNGVPKQILNSRIPELLETVDMASWSDTKIRKFSKGMLQRLGMAQAMISDPDVLFLDEPTDGIDPIGRREIRDLLIRLRNMGKTIFLNSHLLSEVERVSDEVAILKNGKLLEKGRVDDFVSKKEQFQVRVAGDDAHFKRICSEEGVTHSGDENTPLIKVRDHQHLNRLIDRIRSEHMEIQAVIPHKISLEDFFIEVLDEGREEQA